MRIRKEVTGRGLFTMALLILVVSPLYSNEEADLTKKGEKDHVGQNEHPIYRHKMKRIDGESRSLGHYKGKVMLVVNVASKCGLTPQYQQLVKLDEKYRDEGLAILGFPANNFGSQEPGCNGEIREFCSANYGVKFDMFEKVSVMGEDIHPLFKDLTSRENDAEHGGEIKWNFTKFLADRDGKVVARFEPQTKPDDPEVIKAIEQALR